jgi:hypothetical protein
MASRCSSASLAASPASFQPSNAATTIVLCSSGNEALTSDEVTQLGYGVIKVAARRAAAIFHSPAMLVPMKEPNEHAYDTDILETKYVRLQSG